MKNNSPCRKNTTTGDQDTDWFSKGYNKGIWFAQEEADYDDLAAISRSGGIPSAWDIFRAEMINEHLGEKGFDFSEYAAGFAKACIEIFNQI